jgi:chromosome segregation ATPase
VISSAGGRDRCRGQPGDLKRQEPMQLPPLPPIPFRQGKPLDIRATVMAIAARTRILEKVVSGLETEIAGFRNDVDNLDKTVGDPLAKLGTEMRALTSSAETKRIEIQSLKEEFALRRAEIAVRHDELAILARDTHRLKQDNETFFIQINQLKTDTALLKTESALEGARMDKLLADSATIQLENEALCTNFEKLQAERDNFQTDVEKLKKVYADILPFAGDHYAMVHSHPRQQKEGSKGPQFTLKRKRGRADREERVLKGSTPKRQKPAQVA